MYAADLNDMPRSEAHLWACSNCAFGGKGLRGIDQLMGRRGAIEAGGLR